MIKNNYYDQDPSQFDVSEQVCIMYIIHNYEKTIKRYLINSVSVCNVSEFPHSVNKIHLILYNHSLVVVMMNQICCALIGYPSEQDRVMLLAQGLRAVSCKKMVSCMPYNKSFIDQFVRPKWLDIALDRFGTSTAQRKILTFCLVNNPYIMFSNSELVIMVTSLKLL